MSRLPSWTDDGHYLAEDLLGLRDRGLASVRANTYKPKRHLLEAAGAVAGGAADLSYYERVVALFDAATPRLRPDHEVAVRLLYGLDGTSEGDNSRHRREAAGLSLGQSYSAFRRSEGGLERDVVNGLGAAIEAAVQDALRAQRWRDTGDGEVETAAPDGLLLRRSLLHVVRTLDARRSHLSEPDRKLLTEILDKYVQWHEQETKTGSDSLVALLAAACETYLGQSLFELARHTQVALSGPKVLPHHPLPWCDYPDSDAVLRLVPGGCDPHTGRDVKPFFIATFPVTAAEWEEFLAAFEWTEALPWRWLMGRGGASYESPDFARMPAVGMTQYDIWAYCFWLWMSGPYRFRLPYESEWNLACHGGKPQYFPWGENSSAVGNFNGTGITPVDAFRQLGPFGTVGQAGNIWEYTSSLYLGQEPTELDDVQIPDLPFAMLSYEWWQRDERIDTTNLEYLEDLRFVLKGGSWGGGLEHAVVGMRIYSSLYNLGEYAGFRLAVDAVWDPQWEEHRPRVSPFIAQGLQRANPLTARELTDMAVAYSASAAIDFSTSSSCPGGVSYAPTAREPDAVDLWVHRLQQGRRA